jgi:hypothetical protein
MSSRFFWFSTAFSWRIVRRMAAMDTSYGAGSLRDQFSGHGKFRAHYLYRHFRPVP